MKIVAYYRVSTRKQGASGLGLEAQQQIVSQHVASCGGALLGAFTEIESGKKSNRPELAKALAECKRTGATLVIAKLDRLARNVHFISGLMESGVPFVACDRPNAKPFELHIYAAMAEQEARQVSERTRAALHALKNRGVKLGGPSLDVAREASIVARKGLAAAYKVEVRPQAEALRAKGYSLERIAERLHKAGVRTPRGRELTACSVARLLAS